MKASEMHRNEYIKERKRKEVITSIFFVSIIVLFFLLGYFALSQGNEAQRIFPVDLPRRMSRI